MDKEMRKEKLSAKGPQEREYLYRRSSICIRACVRAGVHEQSQVLPLWRANATHRGSVATKCLILCDRHEEQKHCLHTCTHTPAATLEWKHWRLPAQQSGLCYYGLMERHGNVRARQQCARGPPVRLCAAQCPHAGWRDCCLGTCSKTADSYRIEDDRIGSWCAEAHCRLYPEHWCWHVLVGAIIYSWHGHSCMHNARGYDHCYLPHLQQHLKAGDR